MKRNLLEPVKLGELLSLVTLELARVDETVCSFDLMLERRIVYLVPSYRDLDLKKG